ncbi:MAG: hypothetical protein ABFD92_07910 [Planctomycetaceae bacterium]|nr:hypothetical protein [Planctomycetaceae bacterium]
MEFDPLGRKYIYGDEQEAAEDAAWLLYDLFALSADAEIRVTAASFEGNYHYEKDKRLTEKLESY